MTHRGETKPLRFVITRNDKQCLENVVEQIIVKLDHLEDTWVLLAAPPHRSYTIWGLTMSKWQWFDFILFFEFFPVALYFFKYYSNPRCPLFSWLASCLLGRSSPGCLAVAGAKRPAEPPAGPSVRPSFLGIVCVCVCVCECVCVRVCVCVCYSGYTRRGLPQWWSDQGSASKQASSPSAQQSSSGVDASIDVAHSLQTSPPESCSAVGS